MEDILNFKTIMLEFFRCTSEKLYIFLIFYTSEKKFQNFLIFFFYKKKSIALKEIF